MANPNRVSKLYNDHIEVDQANNVVQIVNHDGSTKGLKLGSTLVTATAAELNILDGVTATAAEINSAADVSARIVPLAATSLAISVAAHEGRIVLLNHTGAASTVTLPAATGSGAIYKFIVGAVNVNNHVIKVTGNDVMYGQALMLQDGGDTLVAFETANDSDTITLNGTTTGGAAVGDSIELIDIATDKWAVKAILVGSGTEATPFSATV